MGYDPIRPIRPISPIRPIRPIRPIYPIRAICPIHAIHFLRHEENISRTASPDSPDNYQLWPYDHLNEGNFTARFTAVCEFFLLVPKSGGFWSKNAVLSPV